MFKMEFLRANWLNIASVNYAVDPDWLNSFLPAGTMLDDYLGKHYISLVALRYSDTKVLKIPVPYHREFEEMSLRMYIKRKLKSDEWRTGVTFPKLFFPKHSLTSVARILYKEDYHTRKMKHQWHEDEEHINISYAIKNDTWHNLSLIAQKHSKPINSGSIQAFLNQHYWGYSKINNKACTEYKISRNLWNDHEVKSYKIAVDFENLFGKSFARLNEQQPESVTLTDGSPVIVYQRNIIEI
jgi:uncharacterized protein YqjF (DUF2071 family)